MVRPIPKRLLCHSAKLFDVQRDQWQSETLALKVDLRSVRIEPITKLIMSKDGKELQLSAVLIYDVKHSKPETATFALGDVVEAFGQSWHIQTLEPITAFTGVHHWEVGLI